MAPTCGCASWKQDYDPTDRVAAVKRLMQAHEANEALTGIFYINTEQPSFIELLNLVDDPLAALPQERVRPGREALQKIMEELR